MVNIIILKETDEKQFNDLVYKLEKSLNFKVPKDTRKIEVIDIKLENLKLYH